MQYSFIVWLSQRVISVKLSELRHLVTRSKLHNDISRTESFAYFWRRYGKV